MYFMRMRMKEYLRKLGDGRESFDTQWIPLSDVNTPEKVEDLKRAMSGSSFEVEVIEVPEAALELFKILND